MKTVKSIGLIVFIILNLIMILVGGISFLASSIELITFVAQGDLIDPDHIIFITKSFCASIYTGFVMYLAMDRMD